MAGETVSRHWLRRARPLLGTVVEVGLQALPQAEHAVRAAFDAVAEVHACLSPFVAGSDLTRFHALCAGESVAVRPPTAAVLAAARALHEQSDGLFDVSLGSGPSGWRCEAARLHKLGARTRLDVGGIAKGYAVDLAVQALLESGCDAGWVNAGGDLRAFGNVGVALLLRDEPAGGVRPFATLRDGAFATSHFDRGSRCAATRPGSGDAVHAHASVAAPRCLWADALTKVVAISGDASHPLLARYGAQAWLHGPAP